MYAVPVWFSAGDLSVLIAIDPAEFPEAVDLWSGEKAVGCGG